ncbi:MAG: CbiX/SirB N-terminal domain-containing protein [Nitrospirota bacterium]|nr:CbiX/SirB N-terminal domain-containing protein [Nitrospirota bacterium]
MKTTIILMGHGSSVKEANDEVAAVAGLVGRMDDRYTVKSCFLQLAHPTFMEAAEASVAEGVERIILIPYFLALGAHVARDIPQEVEAAKARWPQIEFVVGKPLGVHHKLAEIVLERVAENIT